MSPNDWIQLGTLIIYGITLVAGVTFGLLQVSRLIVDINDRQRQATADIDARQKRIDIVGDQYIQKMNDVEKKAIDIDWRNKFFLVGLILVICILLLVGSRKGGSGKREGSCYDKSFCVGTG